jgi:hypothetical protein
MLHRLLLPLLLCAPIGCQKSTRDGAASMGGTGGGGGRDGPAVDARQGTGRDPRCDTVTAGAYRIVRDNCASCHQDKGLFGGPLNFILDLPRLINRVAGAYSQRYLVPGNADESLIYVRENVGMHLEYWMPWPSRDVALPILKDFIDNCLPYGPPYTGWPPIEVITRDGGEPGPPDGADGQPCKAANTCDNGGCCVFGTCRAAGTACGLVPGICRNGSCGEPASRCGSLNEVCCPPSGECTAPRAICGRRTVRCEPCGGAGEPCCNSGGLCANEHLLCVRSDGLCQPCGAPGLPCCGEGATSGKKCDNGLCVRVGPGTGDICPGGNSGDAGRGN